MSARSRSVRLLGALGLTAGLVVAGAQAATAVNGTPGPVYATTTQNVTADALPTAQMNGVAWAQVIIGNTVYVGGQFTSARPAGSAAGVNEVPRANLLAYTLSTGVLVSSFTVGTNAPIRAMAASPDGSRLYIGGDFTQVNGVAHDHIAAIVTSTGSLDPGFTADVNAVVRAVTATSSTVYVGGDFGVVNGLSRIHLAALNPTTGAPLSTWRANTSGGVVRALLVTPDGSKLVVAGDLTYLDGVLVKGIGAVTTANGTSVPWNTNQVVDSYGGNAGFYSLSTDGTSIFGTAWNYNGTGNLEGMYKSNATDGTVIWVEDCHGDTYGSAPFNGSVYVVGHPHDCARDNGWPNNQSAPQRTIAFTGNTTGTLATNTVAGYADLGGTPSPSLIDWFPLMQPGNVSGQGQAAWTVAGNGQYLVEAGEFPIVNNVAQQGMVRFAVPPIAKAKRGPRSSSKGFTPTAQVQFNGSVAVSIPADWDQDSMTLHYALLRNGTQVATSDAVSTFWTIPTISFTDAPPRGGSYTYTVTVKDDDNNTVTSSAVTVHT